MEQTDFGFIFVIDDWISSTEKCAEVMEKVEDLQTYIRALQNAELLSASMAVTLL